MATDLRQQLARVTLKTRMLADLYTALLDEKRRADDRIDELSAETSRQRRQILTLQEQMQHMRVSHTISSSSREDLAATRAMLKEMLREIDRCIQLLKD